MPNPNGRPTYFNDTIKARIKLLAEKGLTEADICKATAIPVRTLENWKKRYPEFWQELKDWKLTADTKVERSLYERACGYEHPEDKIFCKQDGEIIIQPTVKHYPPDPTSMIFWLKNRQGARWRDRQEMTVDVSTNLMDLAIQAAKKVMGK